MEDLIRYGIRFVWIFLELLSLCLYADSFLRSRWGKKKRLLCLGGIWVVLSVCTCLEEMNTFLPGIALVLAVSWMLLAFQGGWLRRVMVAVLACSLNAVIDGILCILFSLLLGLRFSNPVWQQLIFYIVLTAAELIHLFAAYLIRRFHMPDAAQFVFGKGLFLALLFPALSLILIVIIFYISHSGVDISGSVILTCGVLAFANVVVLYLLDTAERTNKAGTEVMLLNKQMELQTQSILSLEKSYRAQRKAAHEFRHHLQTLRDLLDQGKLDAAKAYVTTLQDTHSTRVLCVNSHHPIVDAILNQKYQAAAERAIDVQMQINDLSKLAIDPERLVVILTNLLDNAIEACERLPGDRQIRCRIVLGDSLFISVSNTALPVEIRENTIKSSKMPREDHGYGLPSICSILDGLNAEYVFNYENGWFRFATEIPLP